MKQFKSTGYIVTRLDDKIETSDDFARIEIMFTSYDADEAYYNGSELVTLSWLTFKKASPQNGGIPAWGMPHISLSHGTRRSSDWELFDLGHNIIQHLIKQFGYHVNESILSLLPQDGAIEDAIHELSIGREDSNPYFGAIEPQVLVHIGLPSMGIRRVVQDSRTSRGWCLASELMDPVVDVWHAKELGTHLCRVTAVDDTEATKKAWHEITAEVYRIKSGSRPLHIGMPSEKDEYLAAFDEWQLLGMHMTRQYVAAGKASRLNELADPDLRFRSGFAR